MSQPGAAMVQNGKRIVDALGFTMIYNSAGRCTDCCRPQVKATKHLFGSEPWELAGLTRDGNTFCAFWRIREVFFCSPTAFPWLAAGNIDTAGNLGDMPERVKMLGPVDLELQIGCLTTNGANIQWPGSCDTLTPRSEFP